MLTDSPQDNNPNEALLLYCTVAVTLELFPAYVWVADKNRKFD